MSETKVMVRNLNNNPNYYLMLEYCIPKTIKDIRILLENCYRIENIKDVRDNMMYGRSIINNRIINSL
jgi:hypothetical protein